MAELRANVSEIFVSLQGEGLYTGRRHLFVRFAGCPLRCRWCDTPESLVSVRECRVDGPDGTERYASPLELPALDAIVARLAAEAPPLHAIAVTGGEPLAQTEALEAWLPGRTTKTPVLLETAGIWPERLARLLRSVGIVSLDVKCPSNSGERPRWEEHAACVAAAVASDAEVYVKMPVDADTDQAEVERGAEIVATAGPDVPLFLMPIARLDGPGLTIDGAALDRLHAIASRVHRDVRVLPQMHKMLGVP